MSKNFTDINANNSEMRVIATTRSSSGTNTPIAVPLANVTTATNRIATSSAHNLTANDILRYKANGTPIGGLTDDEIVHVKEIISTTVFTLSEVSGGTILNLTGQGNNAQTFILPYLKRQLSLLSAFIQRHSI